MVTTNGRTDIVGAPIQLGDFFPERRYVDLNGQSYLAWVTTNKRYPRSIMAKLDRAARTYNRTIAPLLEPLEEGDEVTQERIDAAENQPEAWQKYVSESVMLLVPNLLESEVELIELPALENLLVQLGYFTAPPPTDENQQSTEASQPNSPLTGDISPQDSVGSTPVTESMSS